MSNKPGMLPGDDFSFDEWKSARESLSTTPEALPDDVVAAYKTLLHACQRHGVPHVATFGLRIGERTLYDLLDKPQNVSHPLLLARSAVVQDPGHKLALMAYSLQSLDLSKLQL